MAYKGTYTKALLLLIVFFMNTTVSFACSFSSFFHGLHHHNNAITETHFHDGQDKHVHEHAGYHHHDNRQSNGDSKEDCCTQNAVFIGKVEKSASRSIDAPAIFFQYNLIEKSDSEVSFLVERQQLQHLRYDIFSSLPDIRIIIQSFLI